MRIAVACMMHETNTFNRETTPLDAFHPAAGDEVDDQAYWKGPNTTRGIIDRLRAARVDVRLGFFARSIPSGLVQAAAYREFRERIISGVLAAAPCDGVCLALHGSMCAEGEDDPEGDLLERLRAAVGPNVRITCALDMHATLTPRMVRNADGFAAYLTAPHLDEYQTGERAADILLAALRTGAALTCGYAQIPMLLAGEQSETDAQPMKSLMGLRKHVADSGGLLDASFCLGFPWADSPHAGVFAITTGWAVQAESVVAAAQSLAAGFWARRFDFRFTTEAYPPHEALAVALASPRGPAIVSDSGDNPTAGASQDCVTLLAALVANPSTPALVSAVVDKRAFAACQRAGEGNALDVDVGRMSPADPRPLHLPGARVYRVTVWHETGIALLDIGRVRLILCDRRIPVYEPSLIYAMGLEPRDYKVIVVKCGYQGPEYRAIAARGILALTEGDSGEDLRVLPYKRVPRPIYPLDNETRWSPDKG